MRPETRQTLVGTVKVGWEFSQNTWSLPVPPFITSFDRTFSFHKPSMSQKPYLQAFWICGNDVQEPEWHHESPPTPRVSPTIMDSDYVYKHVNPWGWTLLHRRGGGRKTNKFLWHQFWQSARTALSAKSSRFLYLFFTCWRLNGLNWGSKESQIHGCA